MKKTTKNSVLVLTYVVKLHRKDYEKSRGQISDKGWINAVDSAAQTYRAVFDSGKNNVCHLAPPDQMIDDAYEIANTMRKAWQEETEEN